MITKMYKYMQDVGEGLAGCLSLVTGFVIVVANLAVSIIDNKHPKEVITAYLLGLVAFFFITSFIQFKDDGYIPQKGVLVFNFLWPGYVVFWTVALIIFSIVNLSKPFIFIHKNLGNFILNFHSNFKHIAYKAGSYTAKFLYRPTKLLNQKQTVYRTPEEKCERCGKF